MSVQTAKAKIGCIFGTLDLLFRLPVWWFIIYQIITTLQLSQTVIGAFWVYVVFSFVLGLGKSIAEVIAEEG